MNKLTKDSKIVNLTGYACGYYSGTEAYAQTFLPLEFYNEYKEEIDAFSYSVGELDGKHSECDMDIEVEIINVLEYWDYINNECDYNESFVENLAYNLKDKISCEETYKLLNSFEGALKNIPKLTETNIENIKTTKELEIEGIIVPIGSDIKIYIIKNNTVSEDWFIEY